MVENSEAANVLLPSQQASCYYGTNEQVLEAPVGSVREEYDGHALWGERYG